MYQTDENIIAGCRKGDRKAQKELYLKYKSMLFNTCLRYASDRSQAEDFLQEGLIRIYSSLYQYKATAAFGAWMHKVMVNACLGQLRKKQQLFQPLEEYQMSGLTNEDESLFDTERSEAIMKMVQQLPDGYRAVFNLHVMEGFAHKEIAQQLGITASASRSQLTRAKAMLRNMLEKVFVDLN